MDEDIIPSSVIDRYVFLKNEKLFSDANSILLWASYFRGYISAEIFIKVIRRKFMAYFEKSRDDNIDDTDGECRMYSIHISPTNLLTWRWHECANQIPRTAVDGIGLDRFVIDPLDYEIRFNTNARMFDGDKKINLSDLSIVLTMTKRSDKHCSAYNKILKDMLVPIMSEEEILKVIRDKWEPEQIIKYIREQIPQEFKKSRLSFAIKDHTDWAKSIPKTIKDVAWMRRSAAVNFFTSISVRK
jgi:hypothetical protein